MRDGRIIHTGETLIIACLMHATGAGRNSKDMEDLRRVMRDINLDRKK